MFETKKMLEKQIDQYTNTIFTLEQQGFVLEGAQTMEYY